MTQSTTDTETETTDVAPEAGPGAVEVRRNGALAAVVGSLATLVAVAYLARAVTSGSWVDWLVFAAVGALALAHATAFLDARTPLLVVDTTGIRLRLGRSWHGLPWEDLDEIEHAPRRSLLRDGRLVAFPTDADAATASLTPMARCQAALAQRVHGAPFAVPLGITTVVTGAEEGLTAALLALAPEAAMVVEVVPTESDRGQAPDAETDPSALSVTDRDDDLDTGGIEAVHDRDDDGDDDGDDDHREDTVLRPNPLRRAARAAEAALAARSAARAASRDEEDPDREDTAIRARPLLPTRTPSPVREPSRAVRSDVTRTVPTRTRDSRELVSGSSALAQHLDEVRVTDLPEADELRRQADDHFAGGDDTGVWRATTGVVDELTAPSVEPVIGPRLAAGRELLGLGVDQLAERTRIRAHVIDAIEIDDFAPCGGDFYARGHLRTLARVVNLDAAPLLATYDELYAAAPIDPRRVFEAELSTGAGGSIRSLRGGANWSVIVAAVMAVVLAWSIARLVMDQPQDAASDSPSLSSGSAGLTSGSTNLAPAVPVVLTAEGGGAKVVVRDGAGKVVLKGDLAFGQSRTVKAAPPVRVQTSDGSLTVGVDGQDPAAMGRAGRAARDTFVP